MKCMGIFMSSMLLSIALIEADIVKAEMPLRPDDSRDLSKYENGGTYDLALENRDGWPRLTGEVREFVWNHWRVHRLGWVRVTEHSVDAWAKTSYFIEPDAAGKWRVRIDLERGHAGALLPDGKSAATLKKDTYDAYRLDRVETGSDPLSAEALVPDDVTRSGQSYTIVFKGRKGDLLHRL